METRIIEDWLKLDSKLKIEHCYSGGYGCGVGYGYSGGSGYDNGDNKIKSYNDKKVFIIDGIVTIITNIKGNIAKGYILNDDLTLEKTYIAKEQKNFAHGSTIREATQNLQFKIFSEMEAEEKLGEFKKKFNKTDKYLGAEFFKWHNILTGSCLQGRNNFVKNNGINLEDKFTVKEFIEICKNAYGGNIIRKLEKYYKEGEY